MTDWTTLQPHPGLTRVYLILLTVIGVINLFTGLFAVFVVFYKSPANTRVYNALLLNILAWSLAACSFQALLCQTDVYLPLICISAQGIFRFLVFGDAAMSVVFCAILVIYANILIAAFLPLKFRFLQLFYPKFVNNLSKWSTTIYCVLCYIVMDALAVVILVTALVPADHYRQQLSDFPKAQAILSQPLACLSMERSVELRPIGIGIAAILFTSVLMFTLLALIRWLLRRQRLTLSEKTFKMQLTLTRNLTIITLIPVFFFFIPFAIFLAVVLVEESYSVYIVAVAELWMCVHDFLVSVATLIIYKAYRDAVKGYLYRVCRLLRLPSCLRKQFETKVVLFPVTSRIVKSVIVN